jgi:hypothetical protein
MVGAKAAIINNDYLRRFSATAAQSAAGLAQSASQSVSLNSFGFL